MSTEPWNSTPFSQPEHLLSATSFADLGVAEPIRQSLADIDITEAFRIQEMALPLALAGQDVIGQAKTGTGKTLGFGIPLLMRLDAVANPGGERNRIPQALVVVPTRELCVQVSNDLAVAGKRSNVRVLSIYGGRASEPQIESLRKGVDVVVGTPGRLLDLSRQGHLDLSGVRTLVLDEADEMLDMGFLPDVETIVSLVPANRQTMLFSATMPGQILNLARRYMTQPTHIRASDPADEGALVEAIEQHVWRAHAMDKVELIARVLQAEGRGLVIIFIRTKRTCQKVADDLVDRGFAAGTVHGDLGQGAREQALRAFRNGKIDVLVATDVAARGIDVDGVTHVINYSCPEDEKTYLHRVGRTGRAGNTGVAVTLVDWDDVPRWQLINKALGLAFFEPVETYSSSEHVYTGLGIPASAKGKLPKALRTREGLGAEQVEDLGETGKHRSGGGGSRSNRDRDDGGRNRGGGRDRNRGSGGGRGRAGGRSDGGQSKAPSDSEAKSSAGTEKSTTAGKRRNRRRTRAGKPATDPATGSAPSSE